MHRLPITIYYEDTDAGGVVYYARYLAFAERARTEFLLSNSLSNTQLRDAHNIGLVVADLSVKYHMPAKLEDKITVETRVVGLKNASFTMEHRLLKQDKQLVSMLVCLACVNSQTGKPVRLPESLYAVLETNKEKKYEQ